MCPTAAYPCRCWPIIPTFTFISTGRPSARWKRRCTEMRRIDIGGTLSHNMWDTPENFFPRVVVTQLPAPEWLNYPVYAQAVSAPMQASTYLETGAHMYPDRLTIEALPLERLFTSAVVLKIPLGEDEHITGPLIRQA